MESCFLFRRFYNNDVSISGRGSAHDDDGFGEEDCGASFARRRELEFISPLDFNPKRERKRFSRASSLLKIASRRRIIILVETLLAQKDIIPIIIILVANNNNMYLKHLLAFISYAMTLSLSLTNRTLKLDRFAF